MKTAQQLLQLTLQLLSAGQLKEASRACRKAIQARPDVPEAHLILSEIHHQGGDAAKAREAATRALRLRPGWSEAYVALGNAEALSGSLNLAEEHFRAAIAAGTPSAGIHANLGHVLMQQGRLREAREAYKSALARASDAFELQFNVARILGELGEKAVALAAMRELLKRDPRACEPRVQVLRLLHAGSRFIEMEEVAREGMTVDPTLIEYPHQLGVALWWQGRHDEAIGAFDLVERAAKDRDASAYRQAKLDQASALLTLGRLREGWEAYRWRPTRPAWRERFSAIPDPPAQLVLGKPTRVLIIGEQGLGDELFFLRFTRRLREAGCRLHGRFERKLLGVLGSIPDLFDQLVAMDEPETVAADAVLLSGDLPGAASQESAPPLALAADPARRSAFEADLREFGPPPYIGATWQAGLLPDEHKVPGAFYLSKAIPPELLGAALRPLNATVVILQRRPRAEDLERFAKGLGRPALNLSVVNDDLEDALAVLSLLDEYVGVSNTNTHLRAGCPGKTARVLVPANPEWRWGLHAPRSAWFPNFSVYRQIATDGWSPTLNALSSDLSKRIAA